MNDDLRDAVEFIKQCIVEDDFNKMRSDFPKLKILIDLAESVLDVKGWPEKVGNRALSVLDGFQCQINLGDALLLGSEQDARIYNSALDAALIAHVGIVDELHDEVAGLKQWVNDLQGGMFVNCVYCGHRYGPQKDTPVSMAEVLKQHIEVCSKHPMAQLKKELSALKQSPPEASVCISCIEVCKATHKRKSCSLYKQAPLEANEIDGDAIAESLNSQNFIYENTDENGEWIGDCLKVSLRPYLVQDTLKPSIDSVEETLYKNLPANYDGTDVVGSYEIRLKIATVIVEEFFKKESA